MQLVSIHYHGHNITVHTSIQDLMYKGVVKVTYDRGYAVQTKSLLLESTTTVAETVAQLHHGLGLRGTPMDYALEERNMRTGGVYAAAL